MNGSINPPPIPPLPAAPSQAQRDIDHLRLLRIFHFVLAGLTAFMGTVPVIHVIIGIAMLNGAFQPQPPQFAGWLFVGMGSLFIMLGWTMAVLLLLAGKFLGRREHYRFCFVIGVIDCLHAPAGTVLGVFTLLTLMRPSVKELFAANATPDSAPL